MTNDQETILAFLVTCWPEGASFTKILKDSGIKGRAAENAASALVTSGRVTVAMHSYYAVYRLTHDEAVKQGIDMTPVVPSRSDDVYKRPPLKFKPMQPVRPDAEDAMQIMSRRGDSLVPFAPPIHMGSNIPGGMA
jgi:hypothetical protein